MFLKKRCKFETMFKHLLIVIIISNFSQILKAQDGFKLGASIYGLTSRCSIIDSMPERYNIRFRSGLGVGLNFRYGITPGFTLSSGAIFVHKGYRIFNDSNSNGFSLKHNINNIEVPLDMVFKLKTTMTSEIRGIIGGTMNFNISKSNKVLKNNNSTFIVTEKFVNKVYPMLNLGLEITKSNKIKNTFVFGVYFKYSFDFNTELGVNNNISQTKPNFTLGYRGTYLGIGITYLFDSKNFKKNEEFFY